MRKNLSVTCHNVKQYRAHNAWTQRELAKKLGVKYQNVSRWENGVEPSAKYLKKLADAFEVPFEVFTTQPLGGFYSRGEYPPDEKPEGLTEETVRRVVRQEVEYLFEKYLDHLRSPETRIEKIKVIGRTKIRNLEKPAGLESRISDRWDRNIEALKMWIESNEVMDIPAAKLVEFCLNFNTGSNQRRIVDVTQALVLIADEDMELNGPE